MRNNGFHIDAMPRLHRPMLVAGFDGWGNALNLAKGLTTFLIQKCAAEAIARIDPDTFYRYDAARPFVNIENGELKRYDPPGGKLYAAHTGEIEGQDLLILEADEPNLNWQLFSDGLFDFCAELGVDTVVTVGSLYDQVLHTDRIVSAIAGDTAVLEQLRGKNVEPISYQGPAAIHGILQSEGEKRGCRCLSLWGHCPYYLQGVVHFGIMAHFVEVIAFLGGFHLDASELESGWETLREKLKELVDSRPELQAVVKEIQRQKVRGSVASMKASPRRNDKIINLQDFL